MERRRNLWRHLETTMGTQAIPHFALLSVCGIERKNKRHFMWDSGWLAVVRCLIEKSNPFSSTQWCQKYPKSLCSQSSSSWGGLTPPQPHQNYRVFWGVAERRVQVPPVGASRQLEAQVSPAQNEKGSTGSMPVLWHMCIFMGEYDWKRKRDNPSSGNQNVRSHPLPLSCPSFLFSGHCPK